MKAIKGAPLGQHFLKNKTVVRDIVRASNIAKRDLVLEIGPGKVLKGLARKCSPQLKVQSCGTVSDLEKLEKELVNL